MKDHEYCGNCIFCNSKCPECGSISVRVKYSVSYEYENDENDKILISPELGGVELECRSCGEQFQNTEWKSDERLDKLWQAIGKAIDLPDKVEAVWENERVKILHYSMG